MPQANASGTVYLVDAHSLIFQVFHAIRGMTSPSGLPTNALFGFIRDMLFLRSLDPTYLLCTFDRSEPTFRSDIYPDYKAHREPPPDDLLTQIPMIHQALDALGIPILDMFRFEADDLMATIAAEASRKGMKVYVCTADKDCRQLIDERVCLFNLRKREEFGRAELMADWGVTPEQVVDLQTLVGDSVDNVPGVPGIGIKTAAKLLQEFGTLENILANIDKIPGAKKQEALRASNNIIETSRKLVRLDTKVPLRFDWDNWKLRPIHTEQMLKLCREWGFQSLASQIRSLAGPEKPAQGELFAAAPAPEEELFPFGLNAPTEEEISPTPASPHRATSSGNWNVKYHLVDSMSKFDRLMADLEKQPCFAIDLETTSLMPLDAEIVGIALCYEPAEAYYLPLRGPEGSSLLDESAVLRRLKLLLETPTPSKINQNIKYDLLVLRAHGIEVRGITGDPMVADYLLHAGERSHNLDDLSRKYLNHQVIPITDLIGKKTRKQPQLRMDQVPTDKVCEYAAEDADVAFRLVQRLHKDLADKDTVLRKLYEELELPLIDVLAEMEFNGIRLDVPYLARLGAEMAEQVNSIEAEIYQLAGHTFNIGSLPQLRKVLFDELKLPVQGRTGVTGAPSTDQESLEKLAALDHPGAKLPRKILEHRQIVKLKGTYVDALPTMVHPQTGRIHASFNQTVAATGRLSSSDPNLQNIPVRREMGQQIRQAFLPEKGWTLVTADYSQIELRLLAHFCQDPELLQAFAEERDVHSAVAAQIFHVAEKDVTAEQRRLAKTVNFGVIYGISPGGLAQRLQISKDKGTEFIKMYFNRYPRVEEYQANLLRKCHETEVVTTILGRRRRFDRNAIRPESSYLGRNTAEREAINMEIQGSAADLIKLAMLGVYRRLKSEKMRSRLLLQIHDELVLESPPDELAAVLRLVRHEMTIPVAKRLGLRVSLRVDVATGPNWLDVESSEVAA